MHEMQGQGYFIVSIFQLMVSECSVLHILYTSVSLAFDAVFCGARDQGVYVQCLNEY